MLFPMWVPALSSPEQTSRVEQTSRAVPCQEFQSQSLAAAALAETQVLPISIFLTMSGPPPSHQELQNAGKLVKFGLQAMRDFGRWRGLKLASCRVMPLSTLG